MDAHKKDLAKIVTAGARQDAQPMPRARSPAASKSSSSPPGIPHLLKGEFSDNVGTDVDSLSLRQPVGRVRRHHAVQLPGDGADVDVPDRARLRQRVHPEAVRARSDAERCAWPSCSRRPGCPTACSTSCTATRRRSTRILAHPAITGGVASSARRRSRDYIYETGTRNGKRVQALGGAKNHAVVLPDADLDFAAEALIGAGVRLGRRALHGGVGGRRGRRRRRSRCATARRARAPHRRRAAATARDIEMGPVITCAARDRIVGLIDRGVDEGAALVVDGRKPSVSPGHDDGFFVGPTLFDHVTPEMAIYREEIFGPVLCDRAAPSRSTTRSR